MQCTVTSNWCTIPQFHWRDQIIGKMQRTTVTSNWATIGKTQRTVTSKWGTRIGLMGNSPTDMERTQEARSDNTKKGIVSYCIVELEERRKYCIVLYCIVLLCITWGKEEGVKVYWKPLVTLGNLLSPARMVVKSAKSVPRWIKHLILSTCTLVPPLHCDLHSDAIGSYLLAQSAVCVNLKSHAISHFNFFLFATFDQRRPRVKIKKKLKSGLVEGWKRKRTAAVETHPL